MLLETQFVRIKLNILINGFRALCVQKISVELKYKCWELQNFKF